MCTRDDLVLVKESLVRQQQGYFVLDIRTEGRKSYPFGITADEVGNAFIEWFKHGKRVGGI